MGNPRLDPNVGDVRRIEVITGAGGRRRWTSEAKARIVAESYAGGLSVSELARRHGLRPQQLFAWRHLARTGQLALIENEAATFVPVVADASGEAALHSATLRSAPTTSVIEIELAGMVVRVRGRVPADALVEVLTAVKRAG